MYARVCVCVFQVSRTCLFYYNEIVWPPTDPEEVNYHLGDVDVFPLIFFRYICRVFLLSIFWIKMKLDLFLTKIITSLFLFRVFSPMSRKAFIDKIHQVDLTFLMIRTRSLETIPPSRGWPREICQQTKIDRFVYSRDIRASSEEEAGMT